MYLVTIFLGSCAQTFRAPGMGYDLIDGLVTFSRSWGMWTPQIQGSPEKYPNKNEMITVSEQQLKESYFCGFLHNHGPVKNGTLEYS